MPILISDGKRYRMPFRSLLKGCTRDETHSYAAGYGRTGCYPEVMRASARHIPTHTTICSIPWSTEDDRILRELRAYKVPWSRISTVLDNRPVGELKKRWIDIQEGKRRLHEVGRMMPTNLDDGCHFNQDQHRGERHVSFSTSSDEEEEDEAEWTDDDEESISRTSKVKKVYYIDDEFTLDEVLLLHQVAADWKRDRWESISSRFNSLTGRSITPAQAKTVIKS
ncbi:hypothetical protein BJX61DRAFT_542666 [Aspergillus egyptiacus]|nr:hypothetical protein BJX61DRAFT_542666 [Aspergillus egyptiacus]